MHGTHSSDLIAQRFKRAYLLNIRKSTETTAMLATRKIINSLNLNFYWNSIQTIAFEGKISSVPKRDVCYSLKLWPYLWRPPAREPGSARPTPSSSSRTATQGSRGTTASRPAPSLCPRCRRRSSRRSRPARLHRNKWGQIYSDSTRCAHFARRFRRQHLKKNGKHL